MSSVRLFILDALARHGEMHGHQLRNLADKEHVTSWTDISVGSLYGALKRLGAEGLIETARTEQVGGYPERQVWRITRDGRIAVGRLRTDGITEVAFRPDPVDLALARLDPDDLGDVPALVEARLAKLRTLQSEHELRAKRADPYLSPMERFVLGHTTERIRTEIEWHERLLERLPELLAHEAERKDPDHD